MRKPVDDPAGLRNLFLFESLDEEQLTWLSRASTTTTFAPGAVYREGESAKDFYVLIDGEIVLTHRSEGEEIVLARTEQTGTYAGAWDCYLRDAAEKTYGVSMYAARQSTLLVADAREFASMVRAWCPMAVHLLEGYFFGNRQARGILARRERVAALGSLAAGLTHELNNPAAAAKSATLALSKHLAGMMSTLQAVTENRSTSVDLNPVLRLCHDAIQALRESLELKPLQETDRLDAIEEWLLDHGVVDDADLMSALARAGIDTEWLARTAYTTEPEIFGHVVRWIGHTVQAQLLIGEIKESTSRICELVASARLYARPDEVSSLADLHALLDSTLVMLRSRIGDRISVIREYDRTLPKIPCHAADLNQVWTNIIVNAIAAMQDGGTLTLRTGRDESYARVEISDTGPGIPAKIREKIFEPFFTTKSSDSGTGLGLSISAQIVADIHGDISVKSSPGDTCFIVRIPLHHFNPDIDIADYSISPRDG
ncbi:ATP-binding protein [Nocardia terpenica]|uniref:histidine kinase n=1 Tax=Nocardia terpenica TaxID=455432 RepID=A0A164IXG1_9NOCA|nr:ATP-binding protein [Nocardia terpenica]KZM69834.1 hypothetical protein AWN90_04280 [Nocardia terpenica]NQE91187.1 histidine kinase [Nocardia terpenica]